MGFLLFHPYSSSIYLENGTSWNTSFGVPNVPFCFFMPPTETPHFGTMKVLKEPFNGLTVAGSQPSQSAV